MNDVDNETVAEIERQLIDVDRALDRLRSGTYAECDQCGSSIEESLLVKDPLRTNCEQHPTLND